FVRHESPLCLISGSTMSLGDERTCKTTLRVESVPIKKPNQEYRPNLWASVVSHLFRCPPTLPQTPDAERVVPLGEALPCFIHHQITMIKLRRFQTERAIQEQLPGGGFQQVGAAYHFGDFHFRIIHCDRKLIRGHIISTPDNEVPKVLSRGELLIAEM